MDSLSDMADTTSLSRWKHIALILFLTICCGLLFWNLFNDGMAVWSLING